MNRATIQWNGAAQSRRHEPCEPCSNKKMSQYGCGLPNAVPMAAELRESQEKRLRHLPQPTYRYRYFACEAPCPQDTLSPFGPPPKQTHRLGRRSAKREVSGGRPNRGWAAAATQGSSMECDFPIRRGKIDSLRCKEVCGSMGPIGHP